MAASLTPNEKHFYWQEICKHEDIRNNGDFEIYNATRSNGSGKVKLEKFSQNAGRMFIIPTNTTAKINTKKDEKVLKQEMLDEEALRRHYLKGLSNIRFSNPGGQRIMANTTFGESLCSKPTTHKTSSKIAKLESKIEHERRMRAMAEKEVDKLRFQLDKSG